MYLCKPKLAMLLNCSNSLQSRASQRSLMLGVALGLMLRVALGLKALV